ncbi:hypothetical protein BGW41_000529, partial [Actinomortierella wolfii]
MVGFACRRHDRSQFVYTLKAKTKAVYQPTNRARRERENFKENTTIKVQAPAQAEQAVAMYESSL